MVVRQARWGRYPTAREFESHAQRHGVEDMGRRVGLWARRDPRHPASVQIVTERWRRRVGIVCSRCDLEAAEARGVELRSMPVGTDVWFYIPTGEWLAVDRDLNPVPVEEDPMPFDPHAVFVAVLGDRTPEQVVAEFGLVPDRKSLDEWLGLAEAEAQRMGAAIEDGAEMTRWHEDVLAELMLAAAGEEVSDD